MINLPSIHPLYKHFTGNTYDWVFKNEFLNAARMYGCVNRLQDYKYYFEVDKGSTQRRYKEIIEEINKTNNVNGIYLTLEANEDYNSYHWGKSIVSDIRNICSILVINDTINNFIASNRFCSIQCNYIDAPSRNYPIFSNYEDQLSSLNGRKLICSTLFLGLAKLNMVNGHYYVIFIDFVDKNHKLIVNNNLQVHYVDIDLTQLKTNRIYYKQMALQLINKYTASKNYQDKYHLTAGNYTTTFNEIMKDCGITINFTLQQNYNYTKKINHTLPVSFDYKNWSDSNMNETLGVYPDGILYLKR